MKTDALYLNLFETAPALALSLAGYTINRASEYTCHSEELKKTFRVDAVFTPPSRDLPLVLAEVQFQRDADIYHRIVASYAITCIQQASEYPDVRMVIFFASRNADVGAGVWQSLIASDVLHVVYLDEVTSGTMPETLTPEEQASLMLVRITVSPQNRQADDALAQAFGRAIIPLKGKHLYDQFKDFFVNLYLNKYNHISFAEIIAMIDSTEIFDDIGKSLAVRQYAEEQVQKVRIESALAMLDAGIPLEQVASILHLPVEQITASRT